jgi:hypothetical protein
MKYFNFISQDREAFRLAEKLFLRKFDINLKKEDVIK